MPAITHGWDFIEPFKETEQDLIRFLWLGAADYAERRAWAKYSQLLQGDRLPVEEQKRWLLRYGAIIEQAEEMAGAWHADRVTRSFQALRRLEGDLGAINDTSLFKDGFGYDEAIIMARKAALLRERYVDDLPLSRVFLRASSQYYEDARATLGLSMTRLTSESAFERHAGYPAFLLALRYQRLHNVAVEGDVDWIGLTDALAAEDTPFKRSHPDVHEAIRLYFKAMGYKRLAWVLRPRDGVMDIFAVRRAAYYGEANRYISEFFVSPARDAAWNVANLRSFVLPDGQQSLLAQPTLISPEQSLLLLTVSKLEASVWQQPDTVERESLQLRGDAGRLYHALLAKIDINYKFARRLQGAILVGAR